MAGKVSSLFLSELRPTPSRWISPVAKNKGTNAAATQSLKHFWRHRLRERGRKKEEIKLREREREREREMGVAWKRQRNREKTIPVKAVKGAGRVRTNAICMILHVLARPGATRRIHPGFSCLSTFSTCFSGYKGGGGCPQGVWMRPHHQERNGLKRGNYFPWFFLDEGAASPKNINKILPLSHQRTTLRVFWVDFRLSFFLS